MMGMLPSSFSRVMISQEITVSTRSATSWITGTRSASLSGVVWTSTMAESTRSSRSSGFISPVARSASRAVTGFSGSKWTPTPARATVIFSRSERRVPTPGRPNSSPMPISPRLTRPVTSLVFISSVPRPRPPVLLEWGVMGSLNWRRMVRGQWAVSGDSWMASPGQPAKRRQAVHSTHPSKSMIGHTLAVMEMASTGQ